VHSPVWPEVPHDATVVGFPLLGDMTEAERHSFRLYQVFPYHLINVLPHRIFWFRMQPLGPDRSHLQTCFLVRPEEKALPDHEALVEKKRKSLDDVNTGDITINEMQRLGAATSSAAVSRLNHLEKAMWQLADHIQARMR
jgi:hypothetical protein